MDAVASKQRGSNLIGCCADSTYTHTHTETHTYTMKDTERSLITYFLIFGFWGKEQVLSSQKAQVQVKSRVIDV